MRFERSVPAADNAFEIILFSYSGVPVPARNIVGACEGLGFPCVPELSWGWTKP
jgi:hypothetical protein